MRPWIVYGALTTLILLALACLGFALPLDFAIAVVFGWVFYLLRVVPEVRLDGVGLATALVCLLLFVWGSHMMFGWLREQVKGPSGSGNEDRSESPWRPRWTAFIVGVIVLMFVAGISATGIVHQVGWLLNSEGPLVEDGRSFLRRIQSTNNLKQIGLGLHSYHDTYESFPPGATFDNQGHPMHGWQAAILPFISEQKLYDQIDFDLPWDDPRNASAYQSVVNSYLNPGFRSLRRKDEAGYVLSHYAGNARLLGGDIPRSLKSLTDGSANTLLAGEVSEGFKPWGDPVNWRDPARGIERSAQGFGGPFQGGTNFLFADGTVRFVKDGIDPKVLKALSTPAGGEPIKPEQF